MIPVLALHLSFHVCANQSSHLLAQPMAPHALDACTIERLQVPARHRICEPICARALPYRGETVGGTFPRGVSTDEMSVLLRSLQLPLCEECARHADDGLIASGICRGTR